MPRNTSFIGFGLPGFHGDSLGELVGEAYRLNRAPI